MTKFYSFFALFMFIALTAISQSTTVVISQVYGGGGGTSGIYNADYVELHNISSVSQDISGYYIMYGSAAGNLASSAGNSFVFPAGASIPAGGYLLVATTAGSGLANLPVSADYTFTLTISGTNGKVAFGTSAMLANTPVSSQPSGSIIDLVGYGTANAFEGTVLGTLSSITAAIRNNNGCDDTDNNLADFTVLSPSPRNSASQVNICGVTPTDPTLFASNITAFGNTCITSSSNPKQINISGVALETDDVVVGPLAGFLFSSSSNGNYTPTLNISQQGGTLASTPVFVKFAPTLVQTYTGNIPISGGGAPTINVAATGNGVDATTVTTGPAGFVTTTSAGLSAQISFACDTVSAYGFEYSTTSNFTLGTGTRVNGSPLINGAFGVSLSGLGSGSTFHFVSFITTPRGTSYGTRGSFTTNVTVDGGSSVVISQFYGAGGNPGAVYNADYVELHNRASVPQTITGYTIQYGSATVTSTWSGKSRIPAAIIPAGGYYLIQLTNPGTNGIALPAPDYISTTQVSMSATNGRIALISDTTTASGCSLPLQTLDLVGYGTSSCFEGSVGSVPPLDSVNAAFRINAGCTDNNDNAGDFTKATPSPRNGTAPFYLCSSSACATNTWNGSVSRAWENASNWSCNAIPDVNTIVVIPSGLTNYPEVRSNAFCKKLQTASGAKVDVITGFSLKVTGN